MMKASVLMMCLLLAGTIAFAQQSDTVSHRKNTIRLDLTTYYLYRNALVLGYERVTKPNQSFVISAGYQELPTVRSFGDSIDVKKNRNRNGFKVGGDYRFYLKKENKYHAPHGVYLGPYIMYHQFKNSSTIEVDHDGTLEEAILDSKFSILNIGFQLGYQFIIRDRWTIDITFVGPSLSHYKYSLDLRGNYTFDREDIQNEIILALLDRFPLLDEVISEKEATRDGRLDTWAYGYRYQLTVGYAFGRKK